MGSERLTFEQVAPYFGEIKRTTSWNGRKFFVTSCPVCGGDDRSGFYQDDSDKWRWFCRMPDANSKEKHIGHERPGYWFCDSLIFLLSGQKPDTGPITRRTEPDRPKYPDEPSWLDLQTNPVQISLDAVLEYSRNTTTALKYFGQYGISEKTIDKFKLGYARDVPHCILSEGFALPNISYGPDGKIALRGVQIRRNEAACRETLLSSHPAWLEWKRGKIFDEWRLQVQAGKRPAEALHEPSIEEMIEAIWPKYSSIPGSRPGVWGDDLITLPDNARPGPVLPYIFLTEDAKSAMVLRQEGYPAIAYKMRSDWNFWLPRVFKTIGAVYIIADRDEKWNNTGKGAEIAKTIEGFIQRVPKLTRIITPPDGINDVADLVRDDGFDAMHAWISSKIRGVLPVPELIP